MSTDNEKYDVLQTKNVVFCSLLPYAVLEHSKPLLIEK